MDQDRNIKEIIAYLLNETEVSHQSPTLIVGRKNNNRYRAFIEEDFWVAVIGPEGWSKAKACYTLQDVKREL